MIISDFFKLTDNNPNQFLLGPQDIIDLMYISNNTYSIFTKLKTMIELQCLFIYCDLYLKKDQYINLSSQYDKINIIYTHIYNITQNNIDSPIINILEQYIITHIDQDDRTLLKKTKFYQIFIPLFIIDYIPHEFMFNKSYYEQLFIDPITGELNVTNRQLTNAYFA